MPTLRPPRLRPLFPLAAILSGLAVLMALPGALPGARAGTAAPAGAAPIGADTNYLDGSYALAAGDPGIAARYFARALATRPSDPLLLHRAFATALMAGQPDAARFARRLQDDDAANLLLAAEAAQAGHWDAAQRHIGALPQDGQAGLLRPVLRAWAAQGAGQTDAALAALAPRIAGPHAPGFYLLQAGLIADLAGRDSTAAGLFARARAALGPGDLRTTLIFASFDARHGRQAAALQRLDQLGQAAPEFAIALPGLVARLRDRPVATASDGVAEAFLGLGATLQAADRPDSALLMLRLALIARPDFSAARLLAAELLGDQHKNADALALLQGIAADDPLGPVADLQIAELRRRQGDPAAGLLVLGRLEHLFPHSPLPFGEAGDILRATHHPKEAVQAYTQALANAAPLGPRDWVLLYNRGIAYDDAHDWPRAVADFHHALTLLPNQPLVLNYLGYSWADRDQNLPQAQRMIETAARLRPDSAAIADSLAWVLYRRHDIAHAVAVAQHAAELAPEDATINYHLGAVYWAAGRHLEARYQWQRALTLAPDAPLAAKLRGLLRTGGPGEGRLGATPPRTTAASARPIPTAKLR